uniref:Uncharacterized protein n=1 Tax=Podoviridae sp. ctJYR5 TaxID=2826551 RepID=A0A8S5MZP0_9CAUD|nr:MAG TPA: hypothetical protein [Podoviridae sp. ctJYR5]
MFTLISALVTTNWWEDTDTLVHSIICMMQ